MYGRSIGGISASHLVIKFPKVIKAFIGDRTMGTIDSMAIKRFRGGKIFYPVFKMFICAFKMNNGPREFIQNTGCYKIHCFDQDDDIVDIFSSHHHAVARSYCRMQYDTSDFRKFYESLKYLFEIERELQSLELISEQEDELSKRMYE